MDQKTKQQNNRFWNFVRDEAGGDTAELILYGDIASEESWWRDTVTPRLFSDELAALGTVSEIVVRINSGGGDVFAANAIYTRLRDHKAKVTVKIDGWAASAATIVAMAGDVIEIPRNGVFMIHDPAMSVYGYFAAEDMEKMAEELRVVKNSIVTGYAQRTGRAADDIAALMSAETWYTGAEAVENKFCDQLMFEDVDTEVQDRARVIVNSVPLDLAHFQHIPDSLLDRVAPRTGGGFANKGPASPEQEHKESEHQMSAENKNQEIKTVNDLRTAFPDMVKQIEDSARASERERIKGIEDVALPGFSDIVDKAKFEEPQDAGAVAQMIVAAQKKQGKVYVENRDKDAEDSGAGEVKDQGHDPGGEPDPYLQAINDLFPTGNVK